MLGVSFRTLLPVGLRHGLIRILDLITGAGAGGGQLSSYTLTEP